MQAKIPGPLRRGEGQEPYAFTTTATGFTIPPFLSRVNPDPAADLTLL